MNGQMVKCNTYRNQTAVDEYLKSFNPYESRSSIGIDLVAITRYAKRNGKTVKELSPREVELFKRKK